MSGAADEKSGGGGSGNSEDSSSSSSMKQETKMDTGSSSDKKVISVTVKTPKEKHVIEIEDDAKIRLFKEKIVEKFADAKIEQLCLIFAGKIMKDHESLDAHNVKHGMTVHLVIKSSAGAGSAGAGATMTSATSTATTGSSTTSSDSRPDPSQAPFGIGGLGGLPGMANLGMGSANFMEMQQRMQNEMLNNPGMLRQIMDSPITQSLMSNPEIMRTLLQSNPQMQQLIERNPEINHMLNNPDIMRQTMEIARNPAMLQELMRNQDRAMSNLESIPGGQNALQRMYRDIQEPMLNAAQEQFGANPFQALSPNSTSAPNTNTSTNTPTTAENSTPVPNPWGGSATATTPNPTNRMTGSTLYSSPGMQSLMQQIIENPQLMQNMLSAPYTQNMFQALASNPDMAAQIIGSNPLFAGNPALQDQMRTMLPQMLQQMQNPTVQGLITNPEAMQAITQIQAGMQRLQQAAPEVYTSMGLPGMAQGFAGLTPGGGGGGNTTGTTTTTSSSPTTATTTTAGGATTTTTTTGMETTGSPTAATTTATPTSISSLTSSADAFAQLMNQMVLGMAAQGQGNPPEERFRTQLETLANMGFVDRQANIQALIATYGDVNAAIDRLLNSSRQPGQQS